MQGSLGMRNYKKTSKKIPTLSHKSSIPTPTPTQSLVMITATIITFLLLFISLPLSSQAEMQVAPGTSLSPTNDPWLSHSGLFAFGFYRQGNGFVIGIWLMGKKNITVWTANRDDPPLTSNAKLEFTMNGTLILADQGQHKLIVNANATASSASMLDSGNFVLYHNSSSSSIIWQSFDHPTDTLLGGQILPDGGQLWSSLSETNCTTGRFNLKMQHDGNLVLYPAYTPEVGSEAYWASDTKFDIKQHLYLNQTGELQIRISSNFSLIKELAYDKQDTGNYTIYRATLDFYGVFRMYAHDVNNASEHVIKSFPDESPCEVKGFCGFNSYCTFNDNNPICYCLEGYKFINAKEETLGCERNYSKAESCGSVKYSALYNMIAMENIEWDDYPYFVVKGMSSEDECSYACFVDCNCWAALFESGTRNCMKQGRPLRYVRRKPNGATSYSTTALLKVGNNNTIDDDNNKYKPFVPPPPPPPPTKTTSNQAIVHIILVTTIFATLLCSAIAISCHYMYKIRVLRYKRITETGNLGLNEEVSLRRFSYGELKRATNHFTEELGKGSFGAVYKGALNKARRLIAVKRLEKLVEEGEREFQAEVRAIGKTHHRNLVRLLGFCAEGSKRLLVYEYMSNGSLGKLLFGDQRRPEWDERVRIALDIARGILYLHEECEAPIIHCDIKPQNILMDEFWTAKISDFGLAKLLMPDQTRTFTMVRGTRGYLAPEWQKNTPISVKADVYSYGIVLLETLCCRKNLQVNVSNPEESLLSGWAYRCFVARELNKLVPSEAVDRNVLENMVKVALWCIQDEPFLRPTMKSVVLMLEGITDIAIPPCPNPNHV